MRALIIEDEPEIAQFLLKALRESGHGADVAGNGEDGLALARDGGYDVLMLEDCVGTTSPGYCMEATAYNVKLLFGFMTDSSALIEGLEQAAK